MKLVVAAVQISSTPYKLRDNFGRAEWAIRQACDEGADLVLLPELFHTGYVFERRLLDYREPLGGPSTQWLQAVSAKLGVHLGMCIVEERDRCCFDTFVLASPHGEIWSYRKQFPPNFERLLFCKGSEIGILETSIGRIGVMICFDMVYDSLADQLAGRIDYLLIPSAWPDLRVGNVAVPLFDLWMHHSTTHAPRRLAKKLGVPVVYANLTGRYQTRVPFLGIPYQSRYSGGSAIYGCGGMPKRHALDRETVLTASVTIDRAKNDSLPSRLSIVPAVRPSCRHAA